MAQTNQPMGSSPLAGALQQLQGPPGGGMPPGAAQNMAQMAAQIRGMGTPQSSTGMQTPQLLPQQGQAMQNRLGAMQGMRPMPPPGAPGQGPGGGKGAQGPQQQMMKQQIGQLQGAPPPGAPGQGPGGAKGAGQKQQIARLQRAPGQQMMMR